MQYDVITYLQLVYLGFKRVTSERTLKIEAQLILGQNASTSSTSLKDLRISEEKLFQVNILGLFLAYFVSFFIYLLVVSYWVATNCQLVCILSVSLNSSWTHLCLSFILVPTGELSSDKNHWLKMSRSQNYLNNK